MDAAMTVDAFTLSPTALEANGARAIKVTKTTLKKDLRILLSQGMIRGITSAHRYEALRRAKAFALTHALPFPDDAQEALSLAAKRILIEALP